VVRGHQPLGQQPLRQVQWLWCHRFQVCVRAVVAIVAIVAILTVVVVVAIVAVVAVCCCLFDFDGPVLLCGLWWVVGEGAIMLTRSPFPLTRPPPPLLWDMCRCSWGPTPSPSRLPRGTRSGPWGCRVGHTPSPSPSPWGHRQPRGTICGCHQRASAPT
jgi:hypothetical protein